MTEKTYKMTAEEKASRMTHLKRKFYDINTVPSLLLEEELERRGKSNDQKLLDAIEKLKLIEREIITLTEQYDAKVLQEMILLKPQHQQQIQQMNDAHNLKYYELSSSRNPAVIARLADLREKQAKEKRKLIQKQTKEKDTIRKREARALEKRKKDLFIAFSQILYKIYA